MARRRVAAVFSAVLIGALLGPAPAPAPVGAAAEQGPDQIRVTELGGREAAFFPSLINERSQVLGVKDGGLALYQRGRFTAVSPPPPGPDFRVQSAALNDLGDVGGTLVTGSPFQFPVPADARPFLWSEGHQVDLGFTDGAVVDDVNNRRQVLLAAYPFGSGPDRVWDDGEMTEAPVPEGFTRTDFAELNDAGVAVGTVTDGFRWRAAIWRVGGAVTVLGTLGGAQSFASGITETGIVVGRSTTASSAPHGFVWRDGRMRDLGTLGGDVTEPRGFNVLGHVVGVSSIAPGGELHAFLWRDGRMTDLGPTTELQPAGINVWGQVVGCSLSPETGRNELVLWQNGRTADLTALAGGGHPANCAGRGMNDRGQIVAAVQDPDTDAGPFRGVLWTIPVLWGHLPH